MWIWTGTAPPTSPSTSAAACDYPALQYVGLLFSPPRASSAGWPSCPGWKLRSGRSMGTSSTALWNTGRRRPGGNGDYRKPHRGGRGYGYPHLPGRQRLRPGRQQRRHGRAANAPGRRGEHGQGHGRRRPELCAEGRTGGGAHGYRNHADPGRLGHPQRQPGHPRAALRFHPRRQDADFLGGQQRRADPHGVQLLGHDAGLALHDADGGQYPAHGGGRLRQRRHNVQPDARRPLRTTTTRRSRPSSPRPRRPTAAWWSRCGIPPAPAPCSWRSGLPIRQADDAALRGVEHCRRRHHCVRPLRRPATTTSTIGPPAPRSSRQRTQPTTPAPP